MEKLGIVGKARALLSLIKFEHTIFALPFALAAAVVAGRGWPASSTLGYVLLAMVGARTAAMAFNRIADRHIDARNPRTKNRELPRGVVKLWEAWAFMLVAVALFAWAAVQLNPLAAALCPLALIIILGYSFAKRFTALSHLILGLALAIAPTGAWIAVTGTLTWVPVWLSVAVLLWTAGFDIIYALQDMEFDRRQKLFSLPQKLGAALALSLARVMHGVAVAVLIAWGLWLGGGWWYYLGVALIAGCLVYEHRLVTPRDFSRVNVAFFTLNGMISILFFVFVWADVVAGGLGR